MGWVLRSIVSLNLFVGECCVCCGEWFHGYGFVRWIEWKSGYGWYGLLHDLYAAEQDRIVCVKRGEWNWFNQMSICSSVLMVESWFENEVNDVALYSNEYHSLKATVEGVCVVSVLPFLPLTDSSMTTVVSIWWMWEEFVGLCPLVWKWYISPSSCPDSTGSS